MLNFTELNLDPRILVALEAKGYTTPTPIQAQAIPHLLEGKDLLGIAQTGTGKTAAFSLPIIDRLSKSNQPVKSNHIKVLILTPTRELATQIAENIELYGAGFGLKHAVIFGGVSEVNQIKALSKGLDIVIATPGRFLDLVNQKYVQFSQLEVFVLDEADRMLDLGFIYDIKTIISKLPEKRQNLLFSATMPAAISGLVSSILKNPVKVEVTPQSTTVERINQKVFLVEKSNKPELLLDVVIKGDVTAALVFVKTKPTADKIRNYLEKYAVSVAAIHGDKTQAAREKALNSFREGKIKVLIATDIAARGIDVPGISHVINYDIPSDPESYVHRIGRTARAGREGIAISFCGLGETLALRAVESVIRMKIPVDTSHSFHGVAASTSSVFEGRMLSKGQGRKFESKVDAARKITSGRKISRATDTASMSNNGAKTVSEIKPARNDERPARVGHNARISREPRERGSERKYSVSSSEDARRQDSRSNDQRSRPHSRSGNARKQTSAVSTPVKTEVKNPDSLAKRILQKLGFGRKSKGKASFE